MRIGLIGIHLLCWILFISYEMGLLYFLGALTNKPSAYIYAYLLCIGLFYLNSHIVLKNLLSSKKTWILLAPAMVLEAFLYMIFYNFFGRVIDNKPVVPFFTEISDKQIASNIGRGIYFIGLSAAYWFGFIAYKRQQKIATISAERFELEKNRLELEKNLSDMQLLYVKTQINPHFVFNTINVIYNSIEKIDSKASETILLFSNILRYTLKSNEADSLTSLDAEIDNVSKLIRMAEIRFGERCFIDFIVVGEPGCKRILPMIMGTFMENVLKHGRIDDPECPAIIKVIISDKVVFFSTKNKKSLIKKAENSNNTGIEFARKRLDEYYKNNYSLEVSETPEIFELCLKTVVND